MASLYTPTYNLDLYTGSDKPNLRDQYNAAMGKIDTALRENAEGVTGKAPINHASASPQYGLGSSTEYGHVKLIDSPSSSDVGAASIAALKEAMKMVITDDETRVPIPTSGSITQGTYDYYVCRNELMGLDVVEFRFTNIRVTTTSYVTQKLNQLSVLRPKHTFAYLVWSSHNDAYASLTFGTDGSVTLGLSAGDWGPSSFSFNATFCEAI